MYAVRAWQSSIEIVNRMPSRKFAIPDWLKIALAVCLTVIGGVTWIAVSSLPSTVSTKVNELTTEPLRNMQASMSKMAQRGDDVDRRLVRIETTMDSFFTDAVKKLLTHAKNDSPSDSKAKMAVAQTLLRNATQQKIPAPQDFFSQQITTLNFVEGNPKVTREARAVKVSLADYRSSLQPAYVIPSNAVKLAGRSTQYGSLVELYQTPDGWTIWDNSRVPPESEGLVPRSDLEPGVHLEPQGPIKASVSRNVLIGASQTIDRFRWQNVIFSNVRIRYHGGPMVLDGVMFINCTFELSPDSKRTDRIAEYAALARSDNEVFN